VEPKRWIRSTAPRRAEVPATGLCARRRCSTARRNRRRAATGSPSPPRASARRVSKCVGRLSPFLASCSRPEKSKLWASGGADLAANLAARR
jgi:hypothetical protein